MLEVASDASNLTALQGDVPRAVSLALIKEIC